MADPIVMTGGPTVMTDDLTVTMGEPTVTIVGRTGVIGHIETAGLIETIGHIATIVGATGMRILTIARGAGLAIVPGITAVADIPTS
jgi:hypothetical protein